MKCMIESFLVFMVVWMANLQATTTVEVFQKYPNKCFIETGSYRGDGIQMALDAGFEEVISIELSPLYYEHCCVRFAGKKNVLLLHGDSKDILPSVLSKIDYPVTFWLDGHYSMANTARGDTNTPLLEELECISRHPIKTHTILIDDVRLLGTEEFDYIPIQHIQEVVYNINPFYSILFEDGYVPCDVMAAVVLDTASQANIEPAQGDVCEGNRRADE